MRGLKSSTLIGRLMKNSVFWSVILFAVLLIGLSYSVELVSDTVNVQQQVMLEDTVRRSAVQCYSLEGSYPPNLDYLIDIYGLRFDDSKYIVHYENLGGNLLPDIAVFFIE